MQYHISKLNGHALSSTAQIGQHDVCKIAHDMGFHELSFYAYNTAADSDIELSKRLDGIIAGLSHGDLVVFQSPSWLDFRFDKAFFEKLNNYYNIKKVIFVHDIQPLMFKGNYYLIDQIISMYNQADVLILPSVKMYQRLLLEGLNHNRIIFQEMWDQYSDFTPIRPQYKPVLQFAGDINKFKFTQNWNYDTDIYAYCQSDQENSNRHVHCLGWMSHYVLNDELAKRGGFGIVWSDDDSVSAYLKTCISHKMSTYILAGIPMIVPAYLANSYIISNNRLGFVVNNLDEAIEMVEKTDNDTYNQLVQNVINFRPLISDGYFTRRVLSDAVSLACGHKLLGYNPHHIIMDLPLKNNKSVLIATNSSQMIGLEDLIKSLPEFCFHITAPTLMSPSLMELDKYKNVRLYPAIDSNKLNDLYMDCQYFLDINYGEEVPHAIYRAVISGQVVLAFKQTVHQKQYMDALNLYSEDEIDQVIDRIRLLDHSKDVLKNSINLQYINIFE